MDDSIIISLGGSLIVPDQVDVKFLKDFRDLIISHVKQGKRFVIITGGGKLSRRYQEVAKEISDAKDVDLDWIGIASLKLNAELLRVIFGEYAHFGVIADLHQHFSFEKPIIVGSAYKPGMSSDSDAVIGAQTVGAKKIINLSNADHVYDSDPRENPNAKKFDKISWADYRSIIPREWHPGLNSPFDPIASEMAEAAGISVMIMNGKPLDNLAKCLNGEEFLGTTIGQ